MRGCYCKVHEVSLLTTRFNHAWDNYFTLIVQSIEVVEDLMLVVLPSLYAILSYDCPAGVNTLHIYFSSSTFVLC
jgi:hypothetical protein